MRSLSLPDRLRLLVSLVGVAYTLPFGVLQLAAGRAGDAAPAPRGVGAATSEKDLEVVR